MEKNLELTSKYSIRMTRNNGLSWSERFTISAMDPFGHLPGKVRIARFSNQSRVQERKDVLLNLKDFGFKTVNPVFAEVFAGQYNNWILREFGSIYAIDMEDEDGDRVVHYAPSMERLGLLCTIAPQTAGNFTWSQRWILVWDLTRGHYRGVQS